MAYCFRSMEWTFSYCRKASRVTVSYCIITDNFSTEKSCLHLFYDFGKRSITDLSTTTFLSLKHLVEDRYMLHITNQVSLNQTLKFVNLSLQATNINFSVGSGYFVGSSKITSTGPFYLLWQNSQSSQLSLFWGF